MNTSARRFLAIALLLAGCHGSESAVSAKALTLSGEQRVNSETAGDQQAPAVASNARGDAVVVWESRSAGADYYDIFGQRLQHGAALGPVFRVNTYTRNRQSHAVTGMDGAGNFVVAWRSSQQQGNGGTIFAQRFAADGSPMGSEFQVGPADSEYDSQSDPALAMNESGAFVIVWSNRELSGLAVRAGLNTVETRMIQAHLYAADGSSLKGPFDVMTPTPLSIVRAPSVGMAADGRFAVAWISETNPTGIRVRRFGPAGVGEATETVSDARDDAEFDHPALAMSPAGDFAVGWEAVFYGSGLADGIYFKRCSAATGAFGSQKRAGTAATGRAGSVDMIERAALALNDRGDMLVVGQGGDTVYAQGFDAADAADAPVRLSAAGFAALYPVASLNQDGRAAVAWQSFAQDGDGRGVYLQELSIR